MEKLPRGQGRARRRRDRAALRKGDASRSSSSRCSAARPSRTRACSRCSTRWSTTCRRRSTSRRSRASTPTDGRRPSTRKADDERAVRRAGVQDHERPVRRAAHLLPRLLGHARGGHDGLQLDQGQARAHRPPAAACTPTSAKRSRSRTPATSPRPSGLRDTHHRRHALRREARRSSSRRWSSPSRSSRIAIEPQDQGRPGQARRRAAASSPSRIRRSASTPTRRPARPSSPAWASCTSRSSSTACCASSRSRPTSASPRSPTARPSPQPVEAEGKLHPAVRRPRPVRPRLSCASSRTSAGKGFVFDERDRRRRRSRASSSRPSRRASRRRCERGVLAGFPMVDVKVALFDGSYHDVDSSEMAFEIAGSMAFQEAARQRRAASCSSRS